MVECVSRDARGSKPASCKISTTYTYSNLRPERTSTFIKTSTQNMVIGGHWTSDMSLPKRGMIKAVSLPCASCQIRKIAGCTCALNDGNVFPAPDFKGNHYLAIPACITARASSTCCDICRDRKPAMAGKTFPPFLVHAQRIWQKAHCCIITLLWNYLLNIIPIIWAELMASMKKVD